MLNILGLLLVVLATGVAFRWGGFDERLAAALFIAGTIASKVALHFDYQSTETGLLVIDLSVLVCLIGLALRSDRFWPLWAAAFQLVAVTVHVASFTESGDFQWAYAVALIFWSYPVLIALTAGTWLEGRFRPR